MAESKWDKTLSALNQPSKTPAQPPTVLLHVKSLVPLGKRGTSGLKPKQMLREETVMLAQEKLRARGDKTDFSDLVRMLLERWIVTPERCNGTAS